MIPIHNSIKYYLKTRRDQLSTHYKYFSHFSFQDISECLDNPCQNLGICYEFSNTTLYRPEVIFDLPLDIKPYFEREFSYFNASGYVCSCMPGFEGNLCLNLVPFRPCPREGNDIFGHLYQQKICRSSLIDIVKTKVYHNSLQKYF